MWTTGPASGLALAATVTHTPIGPDTHAPWPGTDTAVACACGTGHAATNTQTPATSRALRATAVFVPMPALLDRPAHRYRIEAHARPGERLRTARRPDIHPDGLPTAANGSETAANGSERNRALSDVRAPCEAYPVIDASLLADVGRAIRDVARREILPRFGALSAGDIAEKAPGDLVTVADQAAERELGGLLRGVVPGSVVVGEEAVAADPGVLDALAGPDPVWIVDPIDGTANFVAGSARFSTLVALAQHGRLLASWTYVPVFDRLATAVAGGGAFLDGTPLRVRAWSGGLEHLPVVVPIPVWYSAETRARVNGLSHSPVSLSYLDTSGLEYIEVAAGRRTAMVITWEYVWDHAAGLLLVTEAGGVAVTRDGTGFRLSGGNPLPLVVAPNLETATALHQALSLPRDSQNP